MEKLQLLSEQMIADDELMQELEEIINYSAAKIKTTISSGTEIYEFVETKLLFAIGNKVSSTGKFKLASIE